MILGRDINLPITWKKRFKEAASERRLHKYLAALRGRHNLIHNEKSMKININNVVMIKRDEKNHRKWKIGIIEDIFMGKDNAIRSVRIRTWKSIIERPIQLLYPTKLYCESKATTCNTQNDNTLSV